MKKETFNQTITLHKSISISIEVKNSFDRLLKKGVYKELHRRKMLSDGQLDMLLSSNYMIGGSRDEE